MSEDVITYYIRRRGKTLGPFELRQLERLRRRGQVGPIDEVSTDRRNWRKLSELEELYPSQKLEETGEILGSESENSERPTNEESLSEPPSAPATAGVEWYYCSHGEQFGPIPESSLQLMITQGQLRDGDLVWKDGFPDWKPAIEVFPFPTAPPSAVQQPANQQPVSDPRFQNGLNPGVLTQPHRGGTVLTLGLIGLFVCAPFALAAWVMGSGDLSQMRAGTMDISGRGSTTQGMVLGMIGTILWGLFVVVFILLNGTIPPF